jgi:hypothetical protein
VYIGNQVVYIGDMTEYICTQPKSKGDKLVYIGDESMSMWDQPKSIRD